jgi:hypothetical protein
MSKKLYRDMGMLAMKTVIAVFAIIGLEDFVRLLLGGML